MNFQEFLKQRRIALGLSLLDIAQATGVSEGTVSRWESGDISDIKRSKLALLAKVLKVSPHILISDDFDDDTVTGQFNTSSNDFIDSEEPAIFQSDTLQHKVYQMNNERLSILFDSAKDLTDDELDSVLAVVNVIRKSKGML